MWATKRLTHHHRLREGWNFILRLARRHSIKVLIAESLAKKYEHGPPTHLSMKLIHSAVRTQIWFVTHPRRHMLLFRWRNRNAMATQNNQDYYRSVSSESTTYMMVPANSRRDAPSKLWIAMVVIVVVVLQIASTTGLFVYLNMSLSQVRGKESSFPIPQKSFEFWESWVDENAEACSYLMQINYSRGEPLFV